MIYQIENKANSKVYVKEFKSDDECFEWIVKHLDLNLGWSYSSVTKIKKDKVTKEV